MLLARTGISYVLIVDRRTDAACRVLNVIMTLSGLLLTVPLILAVVLVK